METTSRRLITKDILVQAFFLWLKNEANDPEPWDQTEPTEECAERCAKEMMTRIDAVIHKEEG